MDTTKEPPNQSLKKSSTQPLDEAMDHVVTQILKLVYQQTGHDFSNYKKKTIFRRIQRRMQLHYLPKLGDYLTYLQNNLDEAHILFKELLIGVTSFFRDKEVFDTLEKIVIPLLLKEKSPKDPLRIWVPGCSTGEEAYSIAILLYEYFQSQKQTYKVQIFGTDIDSDAIDKARLGLYNENIVQHLSSKRVDQFFSKENKFYRVKRNIREMLIFAPHNIIKDPPFTKLDMICCRNLLIYLDSTLQKTLLPIFHYSLNNHGILLLGTSESIGNYLDIFRTIDKKSKVFQKHPSIASRQAILNFPLSSSQSINSATLLEKQKRFQTPPFHKIIAKTLLNQYAPPAVLINKKTEIIYIHGKANKFLEPAPGPGQWKLLDMARNELKAELLQALRYIQDHPDEMIVRSVRFKDHMSLINVNIIIKPILENNLPGDLFLVIFEEESILKLEQQPSNYDKIATCTNENDEHLLKLEKELKYTKESLQITIEELEVSNEELKSSNEELQSTNEELQSTNEEMETSKEELQSLNEELVTINTELQSRISQLSHANDDMKNLLDSTEIATIFLDNKLCIKRFTPKSVQIIHLINSDIGRPLHHIVTNLDNVNLEEHAQSVLRTLIAREKEVRTKDQQWWYMRVTPYRTLANSIDGVVITFDNITARKQTELKLASLEQRWYSVWHYIPDHIAEVNIHGFIQGCNRPLFVDTTEEMIGKSYVNFLPQEERASFKHAVAQVLDDSKTRIFSIPSNNDHYPIECYYRIVPLCINHRISSLIVIRTPWEQPITEGSNHS